MSKIRDIEAGGRNFLGDCGINDMRRVIDYVLQSSEEHFEKSGFPVNHIYRSAASLDLLLQVLED